jgi:peptidoglycan/xylan/chitin deacetylase (PgdA/CDA1 family)
MNSKQLVVSVLDNSGLAWLMRPMCAGRGVIAGLHRVRTTDQRTLMPGNDISVELLTGMLEFLRQIRYDIISIAEIPERLRSRSGRRFAVFTFDDGYLDNLTLALPIFREFQAPFSVFPITGIADGDDAPWWVIAEWLILHSDAISLSGDGSALELPSKTPQEKMTAFDEVARWGYQNPKELVRALAVACEALSMPLKTITNNSMLSWDQMREMQRDPLVTFGVHTVSHLGLTTLPEEQAIADVAVAQERLRTELRTPIRHIAYPFGWYGDREIRIAKDLNFEVGVTVERGTVRSKHSNHLLALPRIMPSMSAHGNSMGFVRTSVYGVWNDVINLISKPRR